MGGIEFHEADFQQQFDIGIWKTILRFAKPYRNTMFLLGLFMVFVAGVDIVMPLMTKYAIDHFIVPVQSDGLLYFTLLYFSIAIFQALNVGVFILLAGKVETGVSYAIRRDGFQKLQELSFSFYDKTPVGWLMARMTSDTSKLSEIIAWGLVDLVWGTTLMSGIVLVMLIMDWKLTLLILSIVPLLAWISRRFQIIILHSYRIVKKTNSQITASFNEGIMSALTTKTLVREDDNYREFEELANRMYRASFNAAVQSALYLPLVQIAAMIGTAMAVWFGGKGVMSGDISYGMLVMFLSYAGFFFIPIQEVARVFAELQNAQASAERVISLIQTEPDIVDRPDAVIPETGILRGQIRFEEVYFEYSSGQPILEHFNLMVEAGSTIALVGKTGGGKTSIISLLCRFYEPTQGTIFIDDLDYTKIPLKFLHSNLGVILQTPHLFSGTILENIRYGKLTATDEEIITAAKAVYCHDFISQLPEQYNTVISEGGANLSTGQKQLISLARAILADPTLLIMDEATSSVDTEAELLIQKALEKLVKGRTSFIIAHRLSTIQKANRILVIENGQIIEDGNHDELIRQEGHYHQLYYHQFQDQAAATELRKRK
ncbi:MAG: ABC transporter ATP-binding protein [FCB group bacterium]|nr:ABC transporter ATP-binding protein [FCB group bacterium]